ncbi:hypothetical protein [Microbacterium sp. cf332]|uniref:hypothetical protein n=1 Tax=Microbacterium sp. cf332 TaxID=1761804 RepID=UPI00088461C3|nr:hypothetical protein [Microbacterium sp. cf332]SDQ87478.1 hypothetical protein SAMN04487847_2829 [Microbacterium sp. cf332]
MGTNTRYADAIDSRAELSQQTIMRIPPCTIPMQAYGPQPLTWAEQRPTVWAWVSWPHKPAERIAAVAVRYVRPMTTFWVISIVAGVGIVGVALMFGFRESRRGGLQVYSHRWFVVVAVAGAGGGALSIGVLNLLR